MAFSKSFDRELNGLFGQRTHWLRRELGTKKTGKPPRFSRKKVDAGIRKPQTIVKRVTIFAVSGNSHIPKLECLAIHHFQPTRNKNKAATKKWTKACPLCTTHKYIESELRDIFRFR
jgi:hypothetical protein